MKLNDWKAQAEEYRDVDRAIMKKIDEQPDFTVTGGGTMYVLTPLSAAAQDWVKEHLPDVQPWQMLGRGIGVEHRYIEDIVHGIESDGLTVS